MDRGFFAGARKEEEESVMVTLAWISRIYISVLTVFIAQCGCVCIDKWIHSHLR